jgi:hypothetical protein
MKNKTKHRSKTEKQVNGVFDCRLENLEAFVSKRRIPRQTHFAISAKKGNCLNK